MVVDAGIEELSNLLLIGAANAAFAESSALRPFCEMRSS